MRTAWVLATGLMALLAAGSAGPGLAAEPPATLDLTVEPAEPGRQLLRFALPLPAGFLPDGSGLAVAAGGNRAVPAVRVLTWHPTVSGQARSARAVLATWPWDFAGRDPVRFTVARVAAAAASVSPRFPVAVTVAEGAVTVAYAAGPAFAARLLAPARSATAAPPAESVEANAGYLWERRRFPDPQWPRIIETRVDVLGGVVVVAHVQRNLEGDGRAPDLGWEITTTAAAGLPAASGEAKPVEPAPLVHSFADGGATKLELAGGRYRLQYPAAPLKRRGQVEVSGGPGMPVRYWRCREADRVPMQQAAWQRLEFVLTPVGLAPPTAALLSPHRVQVDWRLWDTLYRCGPQPDPGASTELADLLRYHRDAIVCSMAVGDDWGNVTGYTVGRPHGGVFGMNRLNHCPPIFEAALRSHDRPLLEAALLWCDNTYDQSIWWGPNGTGGTRYNNLTAMGQTPPDNDRSYMWRSNSAVHFCTKGYDSFLYAYEQTGDPRMLEALAVQVHYAVQSIHAAGTGESRNIGDVRDFVRLYEFTGEARYLDDALRLFRELRSVLSAGDLFSQGGQAIVPDPPFIEDDETGYRHPFAKPYIIGYALAGLPDLLRHAPEEPKLRAVVQAVADFLAASQDPLGGWRYPHPRSSAVLLAQAMEHAWQIVQADRVLGVQEAHLDAIERVLRQRVQGWQRTGTVFAGLTGWEVATGKVKQQKELYDLYKRPGDRDQARDYAEGRPEFGSSPPEGLVYFGDVLAFYLQQRPASRLLTPAGADEPLGQVLGRVPHQPFQVVAAANPDPGALPSLSVWQDAAFSPGQAVTMVRAAFPNVPGFVCECWCYESALTYLAARTGDGGGLELRHRLNDAPAVVLVTDVTPEPGAVEFCARLESAVAGDGALPAAMPFVNLCWQLRRAPLFASAPDPFPAFVSRCFLFTDSGLTHLDKTTRRRIPCRPPDDPCNNPPWVQMYVGTWQDVPTVGPTSWSDYSPDRYTTPVIGVVSRDGAYLAAIANDSAGSLAQAWHDCLHNNPAWLPPAAPAGERRWRLRLYAMANDSPALLRRVLKDFPGATPRAR